MIGLVAKVIGCCLVSLLVLGGFASLIVGLILINQKNTAATTTVESINYNFLVSYTHLFPLYSDYSSDADYVFFKSSS